MQIQGVAGKPTGFYALLLIVTLAQLYYVSYRYRLVHPYGGRTLSEPDEYSSTEFVREWLNTHLVSPFNPSPIAKYCNRTEWHPNLVFILDNANGGIGNVRGNVLDFIFFAIEAGASIVLPGRTTRSEKDISNVWAARAPFDTFFDEEWFLHAMAQACPQMSIYKPEAHQKTADELPGNYLPRSRRVDTDPANTKQAYLEHLNAWLASNPGFAPNNLTLVSLERTLWDIDTRSLPPGFRRNFGQLLRINPSIRRLAGLVVYNLARKFALTPPLDPRTPIPRAAFMGAHLRTEADAAAAGWLDNAHANFSAQSTAYIALAREHGLGVVYVASGNASDIAAFAALAHTAHPTAASTSGSWGRGALNVTHKAALLPPHEAAALRELTWDQQALVDYEVLQRASFFAGIVKSSFSYNIALTRDENLVDAGRVVEPWAVLHKEEGVAFDDGVSRVLGRDGWHEGRIPRGMWP